MKCVLQPWVCNLSMMQQTVLLTATRGPDGIRKDHMVKVLLRWYRRCFLYSAMDHRVITTPIEVGGGSFTGPFTWDHVHDIIGPMVKSEAGEEVPRLIEIFDSMRKEYLRHVDELPHHFQLHFMHAAEILGYKHPDPHTREWWYQFYLMIVNDAHLYPEMEEHMDLRLGDNEEQWRAREEVTAK